MLPAAAELKRIPLSRIRENPVALRTVNRTTEEYLGLVDSIRRNGVMNSISVRAINEPGSTEPVYGLVDGLHRFTASGDAGLTDIPAQVLDMQEAEILEAQILANVHKIETKPVEYSKQLMRILAQNPLMPLAELSTRLSKSPSWLTERLGLVKLIKPIADLVDEGKINLSNAYALAKLPEDEQPNFLDRAMTMPPQEFIPTASSRLKEIKEAKRQGRDATSNVFVPVPHMRKVSELKDEMDQKTVATVLVKELNVTDPVSAFQLGIQWALHMDPASIQAAKAKDEARRKADAEGKLKREQERLEKKEKEAHEKATALKSQLESAAAK